MLMSIYTVATNIATKIAPANDGSRIIPRRFPAHTRCGT